MVGSSSEEALDAFISRVRRTVQCVARAEVFGTGDLLDRSLRSLTLVPHGGGASRVTPLRRDDGRADLFLRIQEQFRVIRQSEDGGREPFRVEAVYYSYWILDRDEREILVYQWHPEGVSDVTLPHLHIPRVAPLPLPRTDPPRSVALGDMHLTTNRVFLEDVVALLIREFAVRPLRADWHDVLDENRAAHP